MKRRMLLGMCGLLVLLAGCGKDSPTDPKGTVIAFFGAMEKNDQAALAHLLDLASLMRSGGQDYAVQTKNPRRFANPKEILDDLTGEGETKVAWFRHQRIIGDTELSGESATVEVTFVDKEASRGFRTKFGLHQVNGKWRIYSFKTVEGLPEP